MPPKAASRGRSRGRGRGGTARGGSAAASSSAAGDANEMDIDAAQEQQATDSGSATAPATATATESTNVSRPGPAPIPVMTASESSTANTLVPASSTSIPSTSASTPAPSASTTRGSKFKPKAVRRSETERQRLAEEQLRIQEQRNAEEARRLARLQRAQSRGRGGRGRGGLLRGGLRSSVAAGPLAAGISSTSGGRPSGGYAIASSSSSGHIKTEGDSKIAGISSIIVDSRIDADKLYNYVEISDEEDGSATVTTTKKKKTVMPMGIRRVEHKEEGVTMTTAAEIQAQETAGADESSDDGLFVDNPAVEEAEEPTKDDGVWDIPRPRRIKKEDGDAGTTDQEPGAGIKTPESPEMKKIPVSETKTKKKAAVPKDLNDQILEEDLQHLLSLFTMQGADETFVHDGNAHNAALEGHMFLFQFPAVLPPLRAVPPEITSTSVVKAEPDDDVVMLNQPPINIDLTKDADDKAKDQGDGEEDGEDEVGGDIKEGGYLGELVVRKSGKVELSWGGQKLDLGLGIPVSFLRTAVLIEEDDVKPGEAPQKAGHAYGMGKIQGAFSLAPAWSEEEDWIVDPKELEIPPEGA
ncbi:hypothetical protein VTJ04DRAFT_6492 [Mycothermus thermophilus]|uniref:uncharacterized protein n=1 Tax=Humicola insolens TaxID=85995 RepID=UPI003743AA45